MLIVTSLQTRHVSSLIQVLVKVSISSWSKTKKMCYMNYGGNINIGVNMMNRYKTFLPHH